jgi:hypothetical protein
MNSYRAIALIGFASIIGLGFAAEAAAVHPQVQQHCVHDYKKFCHQWGIETKGLKNCMHKHGNNLTHACIAALVKAGEVSQSEVDRRKAGK